MGYNLITSNIKLSFIAIILISFIFSIYFYPKLPDRIATHWNYRGDVDTYTPKYIGILIVPIMLIILSIIYIVIPKVDPLKKNIESFRKYYDFLFILLLVFLMSIQFWIILWNLGINILPQIILPIGFAFLFFYISILLEKAKRNWFVGIRTPWTLSSDKVWKNTHKLGGKLFRIIAILSFVGILFGELSWLFIIIPVIIASTYLILYSYIDYEREKRIDRRKKDKVF